MAQWYFNTYHDEDKRRDAIQSEYFSSEAVAEPGRALVREGIQNSLDAAAGEDAVLVRIYASGHENAKAHKDVDEFFAGAWEHFRAAGNGLREVPEKDERCKFLVFEDFSTKGLTGDPAATDHVPSSKNAFFHFFRAEGISDKGEGDRGRWGVGKTVFQRASRINTMFGMTVRHDDQKAMLMGVSILKGHRVHGSSFTPDGWFGARSSNNVVMPLIDVAVINRFRNVFALERGSEPGLSIVVPWLDDDVTGEAIVTAVLRDYFYPVLTGKLEVIVKAPGIDITVDKKSLDNELHRIGGDLERQLGPVIELARWSLEQGTETIPKMKKPPLRTAMQWDANLIPDELNSILTHRLASHERVAIRVPVNVREKGKSVRESFFDVFMVRDGSDRSDRPVFIREGLIIPDVRAPRSRGMTSLVISEDGPLAAFLGDAEGPAHTQWQHDGSNFKGKYVSGRTDLQFVIRSVRELVRLLTESESEEDTNLLGHIFNLPEGVLPERQSSQDRPGKQPETAEEPPPPSYRIFSIRPLTGGFTIEAAGSVSDEDLPPYIEVEAAYEVRRGNAFSKYRQDDFNFSKTGFIIDLRDAVLLAKSTNSMVLKLDNRDFQISVKGFDDRRDVRVRVSSMEEYDAGAIA